MKTAPVPKALLIGLLALLASAASAEVVLAPMRAQADRGPNLVANPGFEELDAGGPAAWRSSLSPDFEVDAEVAHDGGASLRFVKPDAETRFWVSQSVTLNQDRPMPLVVSGWSRAEGVVGERGGDYSVWVDLQYMDGTPLWKQRVMFSTGSHDWEYLELPFIVTKPVRSATVNVLFRGGYTGTVWLDDVALQEMHVEGGAMFDAHSVVLPDDPAPADATATARVASGDGLSLGFSEQGGLAALALDDADLLGTGSGGFWLRDVAADGPWLRPTCSVARDGDAVTLSGEEPAAGLRLDATIAPSPTGLDVTATVADTTGEDRAVTVYFALPVTQRQWTWHDDIARSHVIAPGAEYMNAQAWPSAGMSSAYPWCSLTADDVGLSLSVPMDQPRVCRFVYNSGLGILFVAFDLGLTAETLNFPSRADVSFSIYHHDPSWGFRAATAKYYERHPEFFVQRLTRGGIWMAFSDISKVAGFEDFGFAYDEIGRTPLEFDDEHGITSFRYLEPMTYHLRMDRSYPRTYEGVMQALADSEASDNAARVRRAQQTRRCGAHTPEGRLDLRMENRSWCDGAVFTLNPDPNIREDADCPLNNGHRCYSTAWADTHLLQPEGGRLDGVYIDSMPNWGQVRNYRREHWRTVTVPLTFDADTKRPVLLQIFSTWQFSKWVSDDVHARGGFMHGNGGALWPFFPALLDVTGQETGGILTDDAMSRARTLLSNKPYSPLMNTRFDEFGAAAIHEYFNKSLLYGIFPSFFDGAYMKEGKWVRFNYWEQPELYERDRPLYLKYIPILRRMFDAGWEPVTLARAAPDQVRVERYGPADEGEMLFAVYNPSAEAVTATLTVEAGALRLAPAASATALVSGETLVCRTVGDDLEVKVPLPAGTCEVVRLGR